MYSEDLLVGDYTCYAKNNGKWTRYLWENDDWCHPEDVSDEVVEYLEHNIDGPCFDGRQWKVPVPDMSHVIFSRRKQ